VKNQKRQAQGRIERPATVREIVEKMLKGTELPYATIATKAREKIPGAETSTRSVQWYASRLRRSGIKVPSHSRRPVEKRSASA